MLNYVDNDGPFSQLFLICTQLNKEMKNMIDSTRNFKLVVKWCLSSEALTAWPLLMAVQPDSLTMYAGMKITYYKTYCSLWGWPG